MSDIRKPLGDLHYIELPENADETILRLAYIGCQLREGEAHVKSMGVANVWLSRLPLSFLIKIIWHDSDEDEKELLIVHNLHNNASLTTQIQNLLTMYLKPALTENLEWLEKCLQS